MKDGLRELIGKKVSAVVVGNSERSPYIQVMLVLSDGTYFEFWGQDYSCASGVSYGGIAEATRYIEGGRGEVIAMYPSQESTCSPAETHQQKPPKQKERSQDPLPAKAAGLKEGLPDQERPKPDSSSPSINGIPQPPHGQAKVDNNATGVHRSPSRSLVSNLARVVGILLVLYVAGSAFADKGIDIYHHCRLITDGIPVTATVDGVYSDFIETNDRGGGGVVHVVEYSFFVDGLEFVGSGQYPGPETDFTGSTIDVVYLVGSPWVNLPVDTLKASVSEVMWREGLVSLLALGLMICAAFFIVKHFILG